MPKHYSQHDLSHIPVLNFVVPTGASAPANAINGELWFDTTVKRLKVYVDGTWVDFLNRANHAGTQLSATISDLQATVLAFRLDQHAAPTGPLSLNSQRITSLADPSSATAQDAATANWVTTQIANALSGQ